MSSSSSPPSNIPPRIPVTKSRLPVHQPQSSSTGSIRPKIVPPTVGTTNPLGNILFFTQIYFCKYNDCITIQSIIIIRVVFL
jgi:hypothetical protein